MRTEEMKKVAIIKAEGEAEAARLISESVNKAGPGTLFHNNRTCWNKENRSCTRNCSITSKESKCDVCK